MVDSELSRYLICQWHTTSRVMVFMIWHNWNTFSFRSLHCKIVLTVSWFCSSAFSTVNFTVTKIVSFHCFFLLALGNRVQIPSEGHKLCCAGQQVGEITTTSFIIIVLHFLLQFVELRDDCFSSVGKGKCLYFGNFFGSLLSQNDLTLGKGNDCLIESRKYVQS